MWTNPLLIFSLANRGANEITALAAIKETKILNDITFNPDCADFIAATYPPAPEPITATSASRQSDEHLLHIMRSGRRLQEAIDLAIKKTHITRGEGCYNKNDLTFDGPIQYTTI